MALPKDVTQVMGLRDTADASSLSINPKQPFAIGQDIFRLNPNGHQLLSWVMSHARRRPCETKKFFHMEKAPLPNWIKYIGPTETGTQDTTNVDFNNASTRLTGGMRMYVARSGEVIRIPSTATVATNTVSAIARNFGTSGTPNLHNGDMCKLIAPARQEGSTMREGATAGEVVKTFTTSIVDWPVELTGTKAAERNIDGDPFIVALDDAWEQSADQMESELVFGAYVDDDSGSAETNPLHASEGLMNWISTHQYSLPGFLTRMDLWDIIAEWTKYNKNGGALVTSGEVVQLLNTWAFDKVVYNQDLQTDGINIQTITTPRGTFDLIETDLFGQEENLMGTIMFLPYKGIDYRPLIYHDNRDVAYKPVVRDEKDTKAGMIFGEYGYEMFGEETFAIATGIEF